MTNRWFYLLLALGAAGLAVLLYLQESPEETLQAGFEASCISQNGLLPGLSPAQVPAFCACAGSALTAEFSPVELDSVLSSGSPSEEQEVRATAVLETCFAAVQDTLPEFTPRNQQ